MIHFMKITSFLLLLTFLLTTCKTEEYKTVKVDFLIQHPEFSVAPATFDTLKEQVLVRQAYQEGATFEMVTEQVLIREASRNSKIMDIQFINVQADFEENLICAVPCITYFTEENFEVFQVQPEYGTRTLQRVAVNGNGAEVPAEYEVRSFLRLRSNAEVKSEPAITVQRLRKIFRLPINKDFDTYWKEQLFGQDVFFECGSELTYEVVE